jgi:hypothetical protein
MSPRIRKRSFLITRRFESESSSSSPKRSGGLSSEDMPKILLRIRRCNTCESIFCVCSHCDRGQRYCSDLCRKQARQEQRCAANRRHQQTAFGREAHKLRQRAYRRRQCGPRVTDQGYRLVTLAGSKRHSNFTQCAICGQPSEWVELYKRVRHRGLTRRPRIQLGARPKNRVF